MPPPDESSRFKIDCELDGKPSRAVLIPEGFYGGFSIKLYCKPRADEPFQHHLTIIGDCPEDSSCPALTVVKESDEHPLPVMFAGFTCNGEPI